MNETIELKDLNLKENKMGTMKIHRLLISMALPMMISMLVQAMYNIVDSVFIGKYSSDALTSLSLAFPLQTLMIAVATGTGVGVNAVLSKSLGEKNKDRVDATASISIVLYILSMIVFVLFGIFGSRWFFESQKASEAVVQAGYDYMSVVLCCSFGLFGQICFERLLQSTGKTFYTMITQGVGAIVNIILDPILIFGKLGFPELGVRGAAIATVVGQIIAMILAIVFHFVLNKEIHVSIKKMAFNREIIKHIYSVGVPSIIMAAIGSVMVLLFNQILIGFSEAAVSVFGIYFKLQSFIFMPVFGLNNGMVPILAYNYGARNKKRITGTVKLGFIYAISIMLLGLIVFQAIPKQLLQMFSSTDEMIAIGIPALRIISISFAFAGLCIVVMSMCQALGKGLYALVMSVTRQLVVLVPVAKLLSLTNNVQNVWWSFPIAEIASVLISLFFLFRILKGLNFEEKNNNVFQKE